MATDRFVLLQETNAVLGNEHAPRVQAAFAAFIKSRGEQAFARTDRVGTVRNDHVKRLRRLVNKIDAIINHQREARIVVGPGAMVGQVLTAE